MKELLSILKHRSFKWTLVLTLVYFGVGYAFLHFGLVDYGWIFFVLLPFSLGLAVGKMEKQKWAALALAVGILIFIGLLLAGGLEGMICVLMAVPIIIPLVWMGTLVSRYLTKKGVIKSRENLNTTLLPLIFVLLGVPFAKFFFTDQPRIEEVRTTRTYPYTPEQVYSRLKSVDTLIAEKSFLMKLGLPVPVKCILEKEEIGGLRTCYFSEGTITEKITELEKGKTLRMDVIDDQLLGLNWLRFKEADYYFEGVGPDSCRLTRLTTYTSVLKPAFYWSFLEKAAVGQEHNYVLDNLDTDLEKQFGKK